MQNHALLTTLIPLRHNGDSVFSDTDERSAKVCHKQPVDDDNVATGLSQGMKKAGANKINALPFLDSAIDSRQILKTYRKAKVDSIFSDSENLEKMRRSQSPLIMTGPNAGSSVDVDHLVSFSRAPELDNRFGNLRYLPSSQNIARSNNSDQALMDNLRKYTQRAHMTTKRNSEILKYGNH